MAHRWNAPKVARWEVKRSQWRLDRKDQLPAFLSTLPKPAVYDVAEVHNRRNGIAELYRLTYKHPVAERPCLFHGTTYLGLRDILLHGLRESCVPGEDEFTQPGVFRQGRHGVSPRVMYQTRLSKSTHHVHGAALRCVALALACACARASVSACACVCPRCWLMCKRFSRWCIFVEQFNSDPSLSQMFSWTQTFGALGNAFHPA